MAGPKNHQEFEEDLSGPLTILLNCTFYHYMGFINSAIPNLLYLPLDQKLHFSYLGTKDIRKIKVNPFQEVVVVKV